MRASVAVISLLAGLVIGCGNTTSSKTVAKDAGNGGHTGTDGALQPSDVSRAEQGASDTRDAPIADGPDAALGRDIEDAPAADVPGSGGAGGSALPGTGGWQSGGGGAASTGGVATTGGSPGTGGAIVSSGGTNAGTTSSGGSSSVTGGATTATGGTTSSGGVFGTGGVIATGGLSATGGVVSTGGTSATGGVHGTGGTGACQSVGTAKPEYQATDSAVVSFLLDQKIPNAEFALSKSGTTLVSKAYTCPGAIGAPTETGTMFRLASNSKAWTSAGIYNLIQQGTITLSTKAFSYLGLTTPLPSNATVDPRVFTITIGNLLDHKSGWDNSITPYFDPTHSMRQIALALGLSIPINDRQMAQYMLGQPLQEDPGTTYAYCNFCYVVLGMVIAKASGKTFADYVVQQIAQPMGVTNIAISPTVEPRLTGEVPRYFSPSVGLSAVNVTSSTLVPGPNGGDGLIREVDGPAGGLATSAESMLKLMDHYLIWGAGPEPGPGYTWARSGSDEGTSTWAEQRGDGKRWSLLVNTRDFSSSTAFDTFVSQMDALLGTLP